jgi:hypothetical protein
MFGGEAAIIMQSKKKKKRKKRERKKERTRYLNSAFDPYDSAKKLIRHGIRSVAI